jgi:hypothetical protein
MVIDGTCGQVDELDAGSADPGFALLIGKFDNGIAVGDVEGLAGQSHAERGLGPISKT